MDLSRELAEPTTCSVLDLGAGTGRNTLALARRGHPVDAVEMTPEFANMLRAAARKDDLPVRVIAENLFEANADLGATYRLCIASEVIPDFRGPSELRKLFELAASVLKEGGLFVFNLHLSPKGYTPETAARQFAQQCYSAAFTWSDLVRAAAGLPFKLVSNDSVYDYEREHLPKGAWPPTPWYENWVSGLDVYDLSRDECPLELRWLVFKRTGNDEGSGDGNDGTNASLAHRERPQRFDPEGLRAALLRRLRRRSNASGNFTLPAVPGLLDEYLSLCFGAFKALGQEFTDAELTQGRDLFERVLDGAFSESPRSNIEVSYEAPLGAELRYTVTADPVPVWQAYEDWLQALPQPLFGEHPDARLLALLDELPGPCAVLDIGAGLGRNALPLARHGYRVTAVELTPAFADQLQNKANLETLSVRVIRGDIFAVTTQLGDDYGLALASGLAGDLRDVSELRQLLQLTAKALVPGGFLLLNAHLAKPGYTPDKATQQWAQQCSATLFTRDELKQAMAGLTLKLVADDPAFDYEQKHLPEEAWPPTEVFSEWALGTHLFALTRGQIPVELRWLLLTKLSS